MYIRLVFVMLLVLAPSASWFTPTTTAQGTTYTDPLAYCAAVGTIDAPDARYAGPNVPDVIARGLRAATEAAPDAPLDRFVAGSSWRCMDGKVYACWVGANLPCQEKADTSQTPTPELTTYCQANPNGDIPGFVMGGATVYAWECRNGVATPGREVWQVDARGFIANIWYPISAQGAAGSPLPTTGPASSFTENRTALAPLGAAVALLGLLVRRRVHHGAANA